MGPYTSHRLSPARDEIAQLAFGFYESRGPGGRPQHRRFSCAPNRNSCGTTRNGEVPTNTGDALEVASLKRKVNL